MTLEVNGVKIFLEEKANSMLQDTSIDFQENQGFVLTGMHSLIDIVAGFGVFLLVYNYRFFTRRLRNRLELSSRASTASRSLPRAA